MPHYLQASDPDFELSFSKLLSLKREVSQEVETQVRAILQRVQTEGDQALIDLSSQFDHIDLTQDRFQITAEEIAQARARCAPDTLQALSLAAQRIRAYHIHQKPEDKFIEDHQAVHIGWRWTALESVGLYVPGGTASYPSSVLMNAIPAQVAGVERLVMVVPTPRGHLNPLVLAAAHEAGVHEIYRIGGAQAIAALAYGTPTVRPVVKIVGPGNAYVAEAKRQVFGTVGIDMIAGPSEILICADSSANPEWVALDLLAQAEHDVAAQSILITNDASLGSKVLQAIEQQLPLLPRHTIASRSWTDFGAIIEIPDWSMAAPLINRLAAEHVELMIQAPEILMKDIKNAGALFLGSLTPEAIGDYVAGSNHVLPTARSARFSSGLSVLDFMKRTSLLRCDRSSLKSIGPAAILLAQAEGLEAHARSVSARLSSLNDHV